MICPECSGKLNVVDTVRDTEDVYRRRRCATCGRLVYTRESEVYPNAVYRSNWAACVQNTRNQNKEENK